MSDHANSQIASHEDIPRVQADARHAHVRNMMKKTKRLFNKDFRKFMLTRSRGARIARGAVSALEAAVDALAEEMARVALINARNRKHNPNKGLVLTDTDIMYACQDLGLPAPPVLVGGMGIKSDLTRRAKAEDEVLVEPPAKASAGDKADARDIPLSQHRGKPSAPASDNDEDEDEEE